MEYYIYFILIKFFIYWDYVVLLFKVSMFYTWNQESPVNSFGPFGSKERKGK